MWKAERAEAYDLAVAIRKEEGWGRHRIHRKLSKMGYEVPIETIGTWIYHLKRPGRPWRTPIPETAKELNESKAFLLGVLGSGDGCVSGNIMRLDVTDEDFAAEFARCLNEVYEIEPSKKELPPGSTGTILGHAIHPRKRRYCVTMYSVEAVADLLSYGVSFKEKEWIVPNAVKEASKLVKGAYLRGFFDSQGTVTEHLNEGARYVRGHSKNIGGLREIVELLKSLGITSKLKMGWRGRVPYVVIAGRVNLKRFVELVNFTIQRKREKIEHGLTTYKQTPTSEVDALVPWAIQMKQTGMPYRRIGHELGINWTTIQKRLSKIEGISTKIEVNSRGELK